MKRNEKFIKRIPNDHEFCEMAPFWMMNVIQNNRALKSIYEWDFMVPSNENLFYRYVQEGSKSVVRVRHTHSRRMSYDFKG